jgi:hypothetical protein
VLVDTFPGLLRYARNDGAFQSYHLPAYPRNRANTPAPA